MEASISHPSAALFLVGAVVVAGLFIKNRSEALGVPAVVGYILVGLVLSIGDGWGGYLSDTTRAAFAFLADIGIVVLLFRVGVETDLRQL